MVCHSLNIASLAEACFCRLRHVDCNLVFAEQAPVNLGQILTRHAAVVEICPENVLKAFVAAKANKHIVVFTKTSCLRQKARESVRHDGVCDWTHDNSTELWLKGSVKPQSANGICRLMYSDSFWS